MRILAILIGIKSVFKDNNDAKAYMNNCKDVIKAGVTLEKARLVMGDPEGGNQSL